MSNIYYNSSYDTLDALGYKSNYTGEYKFKTLYNKNISETIFIYKEDNRIELVSTEGINNSILLKEISKYLIIKEN